jgi:uncharacterized FlaG/YvyC family protein
MGRRWKLYGVAAFGGGGTRGSGGGCGFQVQEGLAGQLSDLGIGVAEEPDEGMQPGKFSRVDADDGYGFGHGWFSNAHIVGPGRNLNIHVFQERVDKGISEGVVMDITAINRAATSQHAPAPVVPVDKAAQNREVIQAVKALNGTEMFGPENELRFQQDPETRRLVVRVVNRKTLDVVSQVPAEYILRVSEDLKRQTP